jgi:predicted  nucleic acid-binding Zn-ribbon protein
MRDNDDLGDIPSMVPSRDEVVSRQQARGQPDLVKPVNYAEVVKVSTWPVRIMLILLTLAIGGGAGLAYTIYEENLRRLDQANRRIMDLENRLAMVGDSAEETALNIVERVDFNFSEIDKLWAARNVTNRNVTDLTGRVANTETRSQENLTSIEETNQRLVQTTNMVEDARRDVAALRSEGEQTSQRLTRLDGQVQNLQGVAQELVNLRATIDTTGDVSGGLDQRLRRVEEAVEAIDAYRLQSNQAMQRLQQQIESVAQRVP